MPFTPLDWQDDDYFARLFRELPWTHFLELIRIDDPLKRAFSEVEALKNRWSVRELKRQLDSLRWLSLSEPRTQRSEVSAGEDRLLRPPTRCVRGSGGFPH